MNSLQAAIDTFTRFSSQMLAMDASAKCIIDALKRGNKVLSCGNGGSACDALHLAEELTGRFHKNRRSLPGISLCADTSALTCIGNDYGFDQIFSRQVDGLGTAGDVLVGFTTSGNSPNVLAAFVVAKAKGLKTILVAGGTGGKAKGVCDHEIIVSSDSTARIQEVHTFVLHYWLEQVEALEW
jgi:D-sedoheptulose 7-phosphate isomerase